MKSNPSLRGFEAMRQWFIRSLVNFERGPRGLNPSWGCPPMALTLARHGVALLQDFSRTIGGFESVDQIVEMGKHVNQKWEHNGKIQIWLARPSQNDAR